MESKRLADVKGKKPADREEIRPADAKDLIIIYYIYQY